MLADDVDAELPSCKYVLARVLGASSSQGARDADHGWVMSDLFWRGCDVSDWESRLVAEGQTIEK